MRVIEKQMVRAINTKGKMSVSNTAVETVNGVTKVTLHGNEIAEINWNENSLFIDNCGWETTTTKSRLNAILQALKPGVCLFQKRGQWFITDPNGPDAIFDRQAELAL